MLGGICRMAKSISWEPAAAALGYRYRRRHAEPRHCRRSGGMAERVTARNRARRPQAAVFRRLLHLRDVNNATGVNGVARADRVRFGIQMRPVR